VANKKSWRVITFSIPASLGARNEVFYHLGSKKVEMFRFEDLRLSSDVPKGARKGRKKGFSTKIKATNFPGNILSRFSYFHYGNTWDLEKLKSISKLARKNTASPYQKPPRIFYAPFARAMLSPMPGICVRSLFAP